MKKTIDERLELIAKLIEEIQLELDNEQNAVIENITEEEVENQIQIDRSNEFDVDTDLDTALDNGKAYAEYLKNKKHS